MSAHYETVRDLQATMRSVHGVMLVITCGLWAPVFLLAWLKGKRVLVP